VRIAYYKKARTGCPVSTSEYAILQNAIHCPEAVFVVDFLSLVIAAAIVGDAYFVDADSWNPCYFDGYLGLKAEASLF